MTSFLRCQEGRVSALCTAAGQSVALESACQTLNPKTRRRASTLSPHPSLKFKLNCQKPVSQSSTSNPQF